MVEASVVKDVSCCHNRTIRQAEVTVCLAVCDSLFPASFSSPFSRPFNHSDLYASSLEG